MPISWWLKNDAANFAFFGCSEMTNVISFCLCLYLKHHLRFFDSLQLSVVKGLNVASVS